MTYNDGDYVMVIDPTPYLDECNHTDGLYFNNLKMGVFIGRTFIVSKIFSKSRYKLKYIDESDCIEKDYDVVQRWTWTGEWLAPAEEFSSGEIDCDNLSDIMSMIEG